MSAPILAVVLIISVFGFHFFKVGASLGSETASQQMDGVPPSIVAILSCYILSADSHLRRFSSASVKQLFRLLDLAICYIGTGKHMLRWQWVRMIFTERSLSYLDNVFKQLYRRLDPAIC